MAKVKSPWVPYRVATHDTFLRWPYICIIEKVGRTIFVGKEQKNKKKPAPFQSDALPAGDRITNMLQGKPYSAQVESHYTIILFLYSKIICIYDKT